jgi:hypothetical protein
MVLDDDRLPRYADRLLEEYVWVIGVMEHVVEHHDVETLLGVRKLAAIEALHGNARSVSEEDVYALDADARQPLFDE